MALRPRPRHYRDARAGKRAVGLGRRAHFTQGAFHRLGARHKAGWGHRSLTRGSRALDPHPCCPTRLLPSSGESSRRAWLLRALGAFRPLCFAEKVLLADFCNRPTKRTLVNRLIPAPDPPCGGGAGGGLVDALPRASAESTSRSHEGRRAPHRAAPSRRGVFDRETRLGTLTSDARVVTAVAWENRGQPRPPSRLHRAPRQWRRLAPARASSIDKCSREGSSVSFRSAAAAPAACRFRDPSPRSPPPVSGLCRRRSGFRRRFASPMALARGG